MTGGAGQLIVIWPKQVVVIIYIYMYMYIFESFFLEVEQNRVQNFKK